MMTLVIGLQFIPCENMKLGRVAKFRDSLSPSKILRRRNVPAVFDRKRGMYCSMREARIYEVGACGVETASAIVNGARA